MYEQNFYETIKDETINDLNCMKNKRQTFSMNGHQLENHFFPIATKSVIIKLSGQI